jgi:proteasome alpha subunit
MADRLAYDRSPYIFSPDGKIYQVEYAQEAAKKGATVIGITFKDGVLMFADKTPLNNLVDSENYEKIYNIDDKYLIGISGLYGDTVQAINHIIDYISIEEYKKGEIPTLKELILEISKYIHSFTLFVGTRPLGINILLATCEDGKPTLYRFGCAGEYIKCKAWAIGYKADDLLKYLADNYKKIQTKEDAINLLNNTIKNIIKKDIKDYELYIISKDGVTKEKLR